MNEAHEIIDTIKPLYLTPNDNVAKEVLIPSYRHAKAADCMVGFFSSSSLAVVAPGLATYLQNSDKPLRLIISPHLSEGDIRALEESSIDEEDIVRKCFSDLLRSEEQLVNYTLRSLSYLINEGRIQIKIALLKDALFHLKVWLFKLQKGTLAVHGSTNFTYSGITKNKEQLSVSKSWVDADQNYSVGVLEEQFSSLWSNSEDGTNVIELPKAIADKLVIKYSQSPRPTENELFNLYQRSITSEVNIPERQHFEIPSYLTYNTGPYAHQGKAVNAWLSNSGRGILSMATGSGKTITAMICTHKLWEVDNPLIVVITAPYNPLLSQWEDEVRLFGLDPSNLRGMNPKQRASKLARLGRRLKTQQSTIEIVIVSQDTLASEEFLTQVSNIRAKKLLIGDEVHNLGSSGFVTSAPEFYDFRLGLSATPIRQFDEEGTDFLLEYFGGIMFEYGLKEAINACLVPYDYFIHPVLLSESEMDKWSEITQQINSNSWRIEEGKPDKVLNSLYRKRRRILESAENKIHSLRKLLEEDREHLTHTLIYCTDKNPEQMIEVNSTLNDLNIPFRKITDEESSDPRLTKDIITSFKDGDIEVLTAKRVLDEGVNIPQISKAFILASTTVERQWIQRRGRLLRKSSETGKTKSVIHDFVVLPPDSSDDEGTQLIKSELVRLTEFGELAKNANSPDGPLRVIHRLRQRVYF